MLTDDELIVINHDESREGEYIRIRVILLGEDLSDINLDVSTFHDVDILTISELTTLDFSQNALESATFTKRHFLRAVLNKTRLKPSLPVFTKNLLNRVTLECFVNDADIILITVDSNINLLKDIVYFLKQKEKLFIVITEKTLDTTILCNWLIFEKQDDTLFRSSASLPEKFTTTLHTFCNLMDNHIQTIRVHEYDFSSLVNLQHFFTTKGEVYLYPYFTQETIEAKLQTDAVFQSRLRTTAQVWVKFFYGASSELDSEKFIELIENHIDEDADFFMEWEVGCEQGSKFDFAILCLKE